MKKFSIIAIALWSVVACSKEETAPAGAYSEIRIAAEIGKSESHPEAQSLTRASETAFEQGDEIGLRIEQNSVPVHRNARLTHNGTLFTGERLTWNKSAGDAVVSACHPYEAGDDIPAVFSVPQDQQNDEAFARADFLAASRSVTVEEFANPVMLQFRHVLSKVVINVTDETGTNAVIDRITIEGLKNGATIDYAARTAAADDAAVTPTVSGHKIENLKYEVILVPQVSEAMGITILTHDSASGKTFHHKKRAKNVELKSGYRHKLNITLKAGEEEEVEEIQFQGEIEPWVEGENLDADM